MQLRPQAIKPNGKGVQTLLNCLKNSYQSQGNQDMRDLELDKFLLEHGKAWRRKDRSKQQAAVKPNTSAPVVKPTVKPFTQFNELTYQSTIISKMIALIHKRKGVK